MKLNEFFFFNIKQNRRISLQVYLSLLHISINKTMANKYKLNILILLIVSIHTLQAQGLRFYGNKKSIDQRTSFFIFDKESVPVFTKYLDLHFDLRIQDFNTFGYLLHIVDPQNNVAYSLTYTYINKFSSALKFNTEGKTNQISINFTNTSIKSKWIPVRLYIDLSTGRSKLTVAGITRQSINNLEISEKLQPTLIFGRRDNLVDVPSFDIRNLNILGSKRSFFFHLNESSGEVVHEAKGKIQGKVINPYWLINEYYHWEKVLTIPSRTMLGSKFNEKTQSILFINQDSLYTYEVDKKQLLSKKYANEMPLRMLLGRNYIDETANKIYAYEINSLPRGTTTTAVLDVPTQTWQTIGKAYTMIQLHHHSGFFDKNRSRYIVFGGFGNRQYSNSFLSYNFVSDRWDTLQFKGELITPRFFTSLASSKQGDYLYIYGGVGNESGDQSVGHNYNDDLYRIDLIHQTIKKCWDSSSNKKLVSGERMILSADEKYLYVLRYAEYYENTHLQLYRITVANGTAQKLGDTIPFISKSIQSNISLYYNPVLQKFYSITQEFDESTQSAKAQVYTLSAPAVNKAAIDFYLAPKKTNTGRFILMLVISVLCLISLLLFYLRSKQKRNKVLSKKLEILTIQHTTSPALSSVSPKAPVLTSDLSDRKPASRNEFNKIYLYGIFTMYGKSGRDITYLFSNKIKRIFQYILLNSRNEGVSSTMLNNLFWPEKAERNVKNLKGVTISNLRKALSEIEGVELVYEKGYFKIVISEPCYCDYTYLNTLLAKQSQSSYEILPILERGQLLECTNNELFDKFKQQTEDILFSVLTQELPILYKKNEFKLVLRICAIILKMDPLFEPALAYSIYSYSRLNEVEKIFKIYAIFVAEYRNAMGEFYPKSLDSLMQEA